MLKAVIRGAVLLGLNGIFFGAILGFFIWPRDNVGPLLGMVYGLSCGIVLGASLGFGFGVVRLFTFKSVNELPVFRERITLWKSLSENQRLAAKVGLLVFGPVGVVFILSAVLMEMSATESLYNMSGSEIRRIALVSLCLSWVSLCVACVLLMRRLHSTKKAGKH